MTLLRKGRAQTAKIESEKLRLKDHMDFFESNSNWTRELHSTMFSMYPNEDEDVTYDES